MILKQISILNYKNLAQVELSFSPKLNCFMGQNGMGKTNLLDAIYYLSFCKSAGNPIDSQNVLHDADFFMIQGEYVMEDGAQEDIFCGLKRRQKKQFKRNKKEYSRLADHIGFLPLVQVSPADSTLILGGSEERRRFMNIVISQYDRDYLNALLRYEKALNQRNALLKQEPLADSDVFLIWEEQMDAAAEVVYRKRTDFIAHFIPLFQRIHAAITQEKETVGLTYTSHIMRGSLLPQLIDGRQKEHIIGYTLHGIHKDELEMTLSDYAMKREGSQGQNKSYLIALKLAQFLFLKELKQRTPILLLDDIFDKLDSSRVEQIIKLVSGPDYGQIFITDTNRENLDCILRNMGGDYRFFKVDKGIVTSESSVL